MSGSTGTKIPLAAPALGEEEAAAAREVILSGWVTQGPRVLQFEEDFRKYVSTSHACAVSSCTTALHLALLGVGVRPGDAVITVSHSFIATANAIRYCGAEPVFVDIDPATLNLDPKDLLRVLNEDFAPRDGGLWYKRAAKLAVGESPWVGRKEPLGRLAAILAVHQGGMPADIAPILSAARAHRVPVVEDAACAVGSELSIDGGRTWQQVGAPLGEVACFSFHPRKVVTTGDGGMITTKDAKLDGLARMLRQHGMGVSDLSRHSSSDVIFEDYALTGYNYRLTDIQAAIGIEQLKKLPKLVAHRRQVASWYREALHGIAVQPPLEPKYARTNWQSFIVRLDDGRLQKRTMQALLSQGIATRRGIMCAHVEEPYREAWKDGRLDESVRAQNEGIVLPLYPGMTESEVSRVAEALRDALRAVTRK